MSFITISINGIFPFPTTYTFQKNDIDIEILLDSSTCKNNNFELNINELRTLTVYIYNSSLTNMLSQTHFEDSEGWDTNSISGRISTGSTSLFAHS